MIRKSRFQMGFENPDFKWDSKNNPDYSNHKRRWVLSTIRRQRHVTSFGSMNAPATFQRLMDTQTLERTEH